MNKVVFTKREIEKLIKDDDPSVKFVEKKRTSKSSELWDFFHHIFINGHQQQFVSCNKCKALLLYSSLNGTNSLRTHFKSCAKTDKSNFLCQKTVRDFYFSSKQSSIPKRIKFSITKACTEFCALDGRAFDVMAGDGFQNLAKALFDAGQTINKSTIEIKDLLPHPTTVRIIKYFYKSSIMIGFISLKISRNITRLYEGYKNQLIGICEQLTSFCLIVDQWTEAHTG
jgi:hypothetical protein